MSASAAKETSNLATERNGEEIRRLQFELVRLNTELTSVQGQNSSLERRLDWALRGRLRYKDLWTRALQEVTHLRQEAANATKHELQRREAEVECLRREQQHLSLRAGDTRTSTQHNPTDPPRSVHETSNESFDWGKAR